MAQADTKQGGEAFQSSRRPECSGVVGGRLAAMGVKILNLLGLCGLTPAIPEYSKFLKALAFGDFFVPASQAHHKRGALP